MVHEYSSSNILSVVGCHKGMPNCTVPEDHDKVEPPPIYYSKLVLLLLIISLGTVGNVLSVAVMSRRSLRRTPVSVYLRAIACADILVLWTGCLANIILQVTQPADYQYTEFTCALFKSVPEFARCISAWLLVTLAVHRVASIYRLSPGAGGERGRRAFRRAIYICCLVVGGWLCGYGYNFFAWRTHHMGFACTYRSWINVDYKVHVAIWIVNFLYAFLPAPILISCSIALVVRTAASHKRMISMTRSSGWTKPSTKSGMAAHLPDKVRRMNIVVITIATTYVLLTFPYAVAFPYFTTFEAEPPAALLYTEIPLYANHAINFFLYVVTGTKFRRELRKMLTCDGAINIMPSRFKTRGDASASSFTTASGMNSTENF